MSGQALHTLEVTMTLLGGIGSGEEWLMHVRQLEPSQCGHYSSATRTLGIIWFASRVQERVTKTHPSLVCLSFVNLSCAVGPQADGN